MKDNAIPDIHISKSKLSYNKQFQYMDIQIVRISTRVLRYIQILGSVLNEYLNKFEYLDNKSLSQNLGCC